MIKIPLPLNGFMGEGRRIVSDTVPLISLEKLNQGYDFIRRLYDQIVLPPLSLPK
jgi:hypothetical protein